MNCGEYQVANTMLLVSSPFYTLIWKQHHNTSAAFNCSSYDSWCRQQEAGTRQGILETDSTAAQTSRMATHFLRSSSASHHLQTSHSLNESLDRAVHSPGYDPLPSSVSQAWLSTYFLQVVGYLHGSSNKYKICSYALDFYLHTVACCLKWYCNPLPTLYRFPFSISM